jgi:hypothetical protein
MALGISTFIGDDIEAQRNAARANLSLVHDVPVLSADVYIDAEGGVDGLVAHAEAQDHPTPVASAMRLAALAQT